MRDGQGNSLESSERVLRAKGLPAVRAIRKVLKEFPEKTGLEGKLSKLTIGEVFQVVRYFFVYRRATKNGSKETAATWDEIVVASLSPTSSQTMPPSTDSPAGASPGPSS